MEFWQARHTVLGGLYEQMEMPAARTIVTLLKRCSSDRNLQASFHAQHNELVRVTFPPPVNCKFTSPI